jgi:hypothetical protein
MKLKITILIFFVFYTFSVFAQSRSPIRTQLVEQYKKYIGKEVYNFLLDDSIRKYESIAFASEPTGIFSYASICLRDSISIHVYVSDMTYKERYDTNMSWRPELIFRKKVSRIVFSYHGLDQLTLADIK